MTTSNRTADPRTAGLSAKCARLNHVCASAAIGIMITMVIVAAIIASVTR